MAEIVELTTQQFIKKLRKNNAMLLTAELEVDPLIIAFRGSDEGEFPVKEEELYRGPHPMSLTSHDYNEFLDKVKEIAIERGL